jgi:hypothetical protein
MSSYDEIYEHNMIKLTIREFKTFESSLIRKRSRKNLSKNSFANIQSLKRRTKTMTKNEQKRMTKSESKKELKSEFSEM